MDVIKSKSDSRVYHTVVLDNKIECLIVCDTEAKKSSAAMSVGVGSLKDPVDAQGLAHYLQHMLFMGTQKYPDENDYSNFITKNSGSNNAYTSQEQTNYQFQVSSSVFSQTLDRFAQFFIGPLMSDSSSERELNAVHSQHSKNLQNDAWRKFQLTKHLSKEGHPYKQFSTGDKSTLSNPNLRKMLLDFYQQNYSANLMKLAVYGSEPVEKMQEWVRSMFSVIPNRNYERYQMPSIPYSDDSYRKIYKILPVKDKKTIELIWVLKLKEEHYKNHPGKYVSHLFGHEGKGSLLSFLIKEGLATGLTSYYDDEYHCMTEFSITIDLTEEGIKESKKIIEYTLFYLQMLKKASPQKWIFDEIKLINKMKFDFMQKNKGMMHTAKLAKNMQNRKLNQLIIYPYLMEEWKPQTIDQFLSEMTLDNIFVLCQAKEYEDECDLTQPIYKTKYTQQALGDISPRQCDVSLPEQNHFIPKDLDVLPFGTQTHPTKLYESEMVDSYYKKDHLFGLPKASVRLRLFYEGSFTIMNDICRSILQQIMKEDLRQFVYLAEVAELQASFKFVSYFNADLSISGFRDSIVHFVEPYLNRILDYVPNDVNLFNTIKEKLKRKLSNYFLDDPYRLAYDANIKSLRAGSEVSSVQSFNQIDSITIQDVKIFAQKWKKQLLCQFFISGNIQEGQSRDLVMKMEQIITKKSKVLPFSLVGEIRAVSLEEQSIVAIQKQLKSKDEENSCLLVHFQTAKTDTHQDILSKLCQLFVKEPAFDYLRTKQQLGYIVFCLSDENRGVGGLTFIVQSAIKTSYELIEYVNKFLNERLQSELEALDEKTFEEFKASMRQTKKQIDKTLVEESRRFWNQIVKHVYLWKRKQIEIEEIPTVTLDQFKTYVKDLFFDHPKRFEVHITSHREVELNQKMKDQRLEKDNFKIFGTEEEFRKKYPLYQDFYGKTRSM